MPHNSPTKVLTVSTATSRLIRSHCYGIIMSMRVVLPISIRCKNRANLCNRDWKRNINCLARQKLFTILVQLQKSSFYYIAMEFTHMRFPSIKVQEPLDISKCFVSMHAAACHLHNSTAKHKSTITSTFLQPFGQQAQGLIVI